MSSSMTQRRAAKFLSVNRKTIVRKFRFEAAQAEIRHQKFLRKLSDRDEKINYVQFDDLETSEHSKCKPLSVAIAVEPVSRKILSVKVSQMPAKGLLARVAIKKYGYRKDMRHLGWTALMEDLKGILKKDAVLLSDENPHYARFVQAHLPDASHQTVKGRRATVAGQGEMKEGWRDPLFALNHTCASLRANMSRLVRKTWSNTKNKQGLEDHLKLYVDYHNRWLAPQEVKV